MAKRISVVDGRRETIRTAVSLTAAPSGAGSVRSHEVDAGAAADHDDGLPEQGRFAAA